MASFLSLPLELLVYISSFVSTPDLGALRLTCKQTEKSLYEWFSEEFFVKKQFMLTQPSLQVLLDISRHVSLSKKLKHLIIATNVYDDVHNRFRDFAAYNSYRDGYADQQALLTNGIDREMLTEAFKGLVNLETVDVRDFCGKRERDGTNWNSWGATTVHRQTGIRLREAYRGTGSQSRFVSHVFSMLLYSLGVAGRTPPRFEILLRHQPTGLSDGAFHLPSFTFSAVQPVLQNLKALFLTLNLSVVSINTYQIQDGVVQSGVSSDRALRHFLSCTPNITHLRLNFQRFHVTENTEFLEWLATPSHSSVLPPRPTSVTISKHLPVAFPHLTALEFGQLNTNKETVIDVLTKFAPKLERLSLWRMTFEAEPYNPYDPKPNIWSKFFRGLTAIAGLELNYLKIGVLSQSAHSVQFKTEVGGKEQSETMREYSGKEMKKFIWNLAEDVVVDWPPEFNSDKETDNSDNDDGMDDNDENEGDEEEDE